MSTNDKRCILFVGGGTMGHIAPLVSVMEAVAEKAPHIPLVYAGLQSDLSSPALTACTIDFSRHAITAGKLNRFVTYKHVLELGKSLKGFYDAYVLLRSLRPSVVFCKGGYVSVPIALAARQMGIPVFSHESDVVPGMANRILAKISQKIFTAYPVENYQKISQAKLSYVGQPVRKEFYSEHHFPKTINSSTSLQPSIPLLFITSSQGSRRINFLMAEIWEKLLGNFQIVHQCGSLDYQVLRTAVEKLPGEQQKNLHLVEHLQEMAPLLQHAEIVISRAGGIIAELAASSATTILIPLSTAAQNHQAENAQVLAKAKAAVVLDETTLTATELLLTIEQLHVTPTLRQDLQKNIASFAKHDAAATIADSIIAAA